MGAGAPPRALRGLLAVNDALRFTDAGPRHSPPGTFQQVPTDDAGQFRFFAGEGSWTLRTLAPKADATDHPVEAQVGSVAEVSIPI